MIKDELSDETKGNKVIEVLIDNVWILAIGTDLRILNKNDDLVRVEAVRVKDFSKE